MSIDFADREPYAYAAKPLLVPPSAVRVWGIRLTLASMRLTTADVCSGKAFY